MSEWRKNWPNGLPTEGRSPRSGHRMAAEGMPFPWRGNGGTISTNWVVSGVYRLRIGLALELGICIVLIAVVLDKLSLAWANKQTDYFADLGFVERHRYGLIFLAILAICIVLAFIGSVVFKGGINYLYLIPHNKGLTTENFWQAGVDWIVDNWYAGLQGFNRGLIIDVLQPMKSAYLAMPVSATFLLVMGIGYIIGGIRSALVVGGFLLFIALT